MRLPLAAALVLLPAIALAKGPGWGVDGAGKVEIAGPVEVPLYRGPETNYLPAVNVTAPSTSKEEGAPGFSALATVDLAANWTTISEGMAKELGAKVHQGHKLFGLDLTPFRPSVWTKTYKWTVIPELRVGDVVLRDVRALVRGSGLVLGTGTFEELAVAIQPSKGTVAFAPASQADALLGSVGEAVVAERLPTSKWFWNGNPVRGNGLLLSLDGAMLGATGRVAIGTNESRSAVGPSVAFEPQATVDGMPSAVGAPTIAGAELPSVWIARASVVELAHPTGAMIGLLGYDALYAADIAVDPSTNRVAIKRADEVKASDPALVKLEIARAQFEYKEKKAAEKPAEEAPAATTGAADPGKPDVFGRHLQLAKALYAAEQIDESLTHYQAAAAVAGDNCQPYHDLGLALLNQGDAEAALEPLQKAGELWDRWYAQDLETRQRIQNDKSAPGATLSIAQPSACHGAWGDLAAAYLAIGAHKKVAELYEAHLDLDEDLAQAYGLSLIVQGKAEQANGPLRQALQIGDKDDPAVRTALALAYATPEGAEVLDAQLARLAFAADHYWFITLVPAAEAARRAGGDEAALAMLERFVKDDPLSVQARLAHAWELHRQGRTDDAQKALAEAKPLLADFAGRAIHSEVPAGYAAMAQALGGDVEGARAAVADLEKTYGPTPIGFMARALVASLAGDDAGVEQAMAEFHRHRPLLPAATLDLRRPSGG